MQVIFALDLTQAVFPQEMLQKLEGFEQKTVEMMITGCTLSLQVKSVDGRGPGCCWALPFGCVVIGRVFRGYVMFSIQACLVNCLLVDLMFLVILYLLLKEGECW